MPHFNQRLIRHIYRIESRQSSSRSVDRFHDPPRTACKNEMASFQFTKPARLRWFSECGMTNLAKSVRCCVASKLSVAAAPSSADLSLDVIMGMWQCLRASCQRSFRTNRAPAKFLELGHHDCFTSATLSMQVANHPVLIYALIAHDVCELRGNGEEADLFCPQQNMLLPATLKLLSPSLFTQSPFLGCDTTTAARAAPAPTSISKDVSIGFVNPRNNAAQLIPSPIALSVSRPAPFSTPTLHSLGPRSRFGHLPSVWKNNKNNLARLMPQWVFSK